MGCCSSAIPAKRSKFKFTLAIVFGDMGTTKRPKRSSSKRSFSSRVSNSTSTTTTGISSASTMTPTRSSILSRSSTTEHTRPKPQIGTMPIMHSVCDDFNEATGAPITKQQEQLEFEKSFGYHTESSYVSTSCFRRTQDHSEAGNSSTVSSSSEDISDLRMEMYMMTHSQSIMPKTSSPIHQRRQHYKNIIDYSKTKTGTGTEASKSYFKWCNYLQSTPAYLLHNVSRIPEAIAGQFCPADFPAFTDLDDMDSPAKRFKFDKPTTDPMDVTYLLRKSGKDIIGLTISTEL